MDDKEKYFNQSLKSLKIADHIVYVTMPVINDRRLYIKAFLEIYKSVINSINCILFYEGEKLKFIESESERLQIFLNKYLKNYGFEEDFKQKLTELFGVYFKFKKSEMEFVKNEKFVMLLPGSSTEVLDKKRVKQFLLLAKELVVIVNSKRIVEK
jgi:hypothetical protein